MSLRDNLAEDAVKALGTLKPVEIGLDGTVGDAVALMQKHAAGCVVVTVHGRPVGVFTERDVLTKVLARHLPPYTPMADVMTRNSKVINEGCSIAGVIRTMDAGGFRHMPVVDSSGRLTGVVSVKRIVEYLVEHFPSAVFNLPPDPARKQVSREGA